MAITMCESSTRLSALWTWLSIGIFAGGCALAEPTTDKMKAEHALITLEARLADREIRRIQINAIPTLSAYDPEISEDDLDHGGIYICQAKFGSREFGKIIHFARDIHIVGDGRLMALRWSIGFYDRDDHRVFVLYAGQDFAEDSFVYAKIARQYVKIDKPLMDWLVANVPFAGCTDNSK